MVNNKLTVLADEQGITVRDLVIRAIRAAGSQTAAAQALGVNPNTIRYHVRKYQLKVSTGFTAEVAS